MILRAKFFASDHARNVMRRDLYATRNEDHDPKNDVYGRAVGTLNTSTL